MRSNALVALLAGFVVTTGCTPRAGDATTGTGGALAPTGSGGSPAGTGGSAATGSGGAGGSGGASAGTGGAAAGAGGITATGGTGAGGAAGAGGADAAPDADATKTGSQPDAVPGETNPSAMDPNGLYEGNLPLWDGPPVGPEVAMDCPGDPTAGFTEYQDTFQVGHPYDLPATARFSIEDGIYTFWVMKGDKKQIPDSTATNPRTEARFAQRFKTGTRLWSSDVYWDKSVTNGTVVMQVHTTTTGIGPVYMVANGANVSPIDGKKVPGGLIDRWINLKVSIDADTTASQYWVNNCLVATQARGTRGDGINYFKIGVYHCDVGVCRARVKNIRMYMK